MNTRRPLTLTLAIVLLILLCIFGLTRPIAPDRPPMPIAIYAFIVGGVGSLIALVGLWNLKRWGLLLTIILSALNTLASVPGLWLAPSTEGKVVSMVLIPVNALVLILVALPATRKVFGAVSAPVART